MGPEFRAGYTGSLIMHEGYVTNSVERMIPTARFYAALIAVILNVM